MADDTIPEEWRHAEGWPDYEISSLGRIRRRTPSYTTGPKNGRRYMAFPAGRLLKPALNIHGYAHVELTRGCAHKTVYIAYLVCATFHGPRPTPTHDTAHNDGVRANNVASNLRWATRSENMADKIAHGTHNRGEQHPRSILTNAEVIRIKLAIAAGIRNSDIATTFGLSRQQVSKIKHGERWRHISLNS